MIKFVVGQEIYHARFGRGVIQNISDDDPPIIRVDFGEETKDLVYDRNLLLRMTVRSAKTTSNSKVESEPVPVSSKASFFSSLVLPEEVEVKQFEGMERFHFKYKGKGFMVIDLKDDYYQIRTREEYFKAIGVNEYGLDTGHPTNPARLKNIPYSDTDILKRLINYVVSGNSENGINHGEAPAKTFQISGRLKFVCPTCGSSFMKAKRCPECGQLILYDAVSAPKSSKRILHVGDDVSRLRIFEIINKYFGENYVGWMKASYNINDDFGAWFPTIVAKHFRPGGSYGGTEMWSNTLSPDMKTIISMNHDATIDDIPKAERNNEIKRKNVLIFGRINGAFKFLGVFDDKLVLENKNMTYRHDRLAQGIDLDTFQLIDED